MKLFQKNEVLFAVLLIVIYVVGSSVMQSVSDAVGIAFLAEMLFNLLMSAVLLWFIRKNRLSDYVGLRKPEISASKMLYYIPLLLIAAAPAFFGTGMEFSPVISLLRTVMMICVGFLEEVIFRGFLFRGIAKNSLKRAVVISSLTFAVGHFVNLLNGSDLFSNTLQVVYAVAVGFLMVFIFMRTSSLLACIAFHAFNNCLTAFTTGKFLIDRTGEKTAVLIMAGIQLVIAGAYLLYTAKLPERALPEQ
ncbi:MAG: CPBP family intramembrane metalloprotease [Oscillospiraceae bacterium]|nr:CPBP family intramembrane metalloprotease [Oscillospiraceae bacterium]